MESHTPTIAIIAPCYNEELVVEKSAQKLLAVLKDLERKLKISQESFIYFVDDGSIDATWSLITHLHERYPQVKGLKFSRNFGEERALLAGLLSNKDRADGFITIDADLQDDTDVIEKFIDAFAEGYDIVYGVRNLAQTYSVFKKYATLAFHTIMRMIGVNMIYNHGDFRFASKKAITALDEFDECNTFLRGLFPLLGFRTKQISYKLTARLAGETKYSLKKLVVLAWDNLTAATIAPLRLIFGLGALLCIAAVLILVGGFLNIIREWVIIFLVLFIGGLQTVSIGLVGEYVGRTYNETKARPRFIVDKEIF
jgi:glycosyltransferase involved in cell wall biosynthesis